MKNAKKVPKKLLTLVITALLLTSLLSGTATAAEATKEEVSRTIAIVFDNSGSMYADGNAAWCRATYAIEVFASMLNSGDVLQIYPMNDVSVNGETYTKDKPLEIEAGGDITVIRNMITPNATDTPVEAIDTAASGLEKAKSDEKWLIVLTDGATFYQGGTELSEGDTFTLLSQKLSDYNKKFNVMYLKIGNSGQTPEVWEPEYQFSAKVAQDSSSVLSELTSMCNMIFGRDQVDVSDKGTVDFDVTIKKVIVFVQGNGIDNVELKDASGKVIGTPTTEVATKYSEKGCEALEGKAYSGFGKDDKLSGYVTVYDVPLDEGQYTISYNGDASSINVYYEPDVDLVVELKNESGATMHIGDECYPGTYYVDYSLVDRNGEKTDSKLLGDRVFESTITKNGESDTKTDNADGSIEFELAEGDVISLDKFSATYLSGYNITKTGGQIGWPEGGFSIQQRPAGLLELYVNADSKTYKMSELESIAYDLTLVYEGNELTTEQLKNATIGTETEKGNIRAYVDGDNKQLKFTYAADGASATESGECVILVSAEYTNEYGVKSTSNEQEVKFKLEDDAGSLKIKLECDEYYQISQLDESDGMLAKLTLNGEELSDEQLANTTLTFVDNGLTYTAEQVTGESAYRIKIDEKTAKEGKYKVEVNATATDEIGRTSEASAAKNVELGNMPLWLKWLIALLIIAAIVALIIWLLNRKILPKKIYIEQKQTKFKSGANEVKKFEPFEQKIPFFKRFGEQDIYLRSAKDGNNKSTSVSLRVQPVSTVKDVLFNKESCSVKATISGKPKSVKELQLGAKHLKYDEKGNLITGKKGSAETATSPEMEARDSTKLSIRDSVKTFDGSICNLTYDTKINMKW